MVQGKDEADSELSHVYETTVLAPACSCNVQTGRSCWGGKVVLLGLSTKLKLLNSVKSLCLTKM